MSAHSEPGPVKLDRAITWMLLSEGTTRCFTSQICKEGVSSDIITAERQPGAPANGRTAKESEARFFKQHQSRRII